MDVLTFNGQSFADFHTFWDGKDLFVTPEKDVTFYEIPGRNGEVSVSNDRFKAKEISINCFIKNDFRKYYAALINFLYSQDGYGRLENSKEPDIYQKACFVSQIEPNTGAFLKYGDFTLTFKVYPQKWLKLGENAIQISNTKSILNPTSFDAFPLIEVVGTGSITINQSVLTLANNTSTTFIDCEIEDCWEDSINRNGDLSVVGGFPVLTATNNITVSGFTSVKLYPRWWRL